MVPSAGVTLPGAADLYWTQSIVSGVEPVLRTARLPAGAVARGERLALRLARAAVRDDRSDGVQDEPRGEVEARRERGAAGRRAPALAVRGDLARAGVAQEARIERRGRADVHERPQQEPPRGRIAARELPLPRAPFRHLREKMRDKRLDEGAFHQASSQSAISPAAFRSSGFPRMEPGTLASPATCALHCRNPAVAKLFRFVSTIPL